MGPGDLASHLPCLVTKGFIPLLRHKQASAYWLDGGFSPSVDELVRSTAEQGPHSGGRPGEDSAGGCSCQASRAGVLPLYVSKRHTNKRPYGDLGLDNTAGA